MPMSKSQTFVLKSQRLCLLLLFHFRNTVVISKSHLIVLLVIMHMKVKSGREKLVYKLLSDHRSAKCVTFVTLSKIN